MNIEKIILEPQMPDESDTAQTLRVAAYCRVSTDNEEQRTSFENQVRSYTDMIESRPGWKLAGNQCQQLKRNWHLPRKKIK